MAAVDDEWGRRTVHHRCLVLSGVLTVVFWSKTRCQETRSVLPPIHTHIITSITYIHKIIDILYTWIVIIWLEPNIVPAYYY